MQTKQDFHYYGATGSVWATADTREDVLKKLARAEGAKFIAQQEKVHGGLYAMLTRVPLPQSAHYSINNYLPWATPDGERIQLTERESVRIIDTKGNIMLVNAD